MPVILRYSVTDVDVDFDKIRREEVIEYVKRQYGTENVAQIITYGTMKARAAVRDVGRVMEIPLPEVDKIAKMVPGAIDMTLDKALSIEPRLKEMIAKDTRIRELFDYAKGVEGLPRHASTHAAGVVIADKSIDEYVPLYRAGEDSITTQFDMKHSEKAGLVKFDFLGLRTLTMMRIATDLVRERHGIDLNLNQISLNDSKVFDLLCRGGTPGIFQSESSGFTGLLMRLKPDCFEHLIDMVALYRPGPLQSGMVDAFIDCRHGRKPIQYLIPELETILKVTYGVIVYQEQVMQIGVAVGGFTLAQADTLRKAMGKKDSKLMAEFQERFVDGAVGRNIAREKAEEIFNLMAQFAAYGFNKSHSAAYAFIAYQTAYLKAHFPVEFMTALLTSEAEEGNTSKVIQYIAHCKEEGITLLPPDINESWYVFRPAGERGLRFGLSAIKGLGESALLVIAEAKKKGSFKNFRDFLERVDLRKVNKKAIECLIKAGAFDSLDPNRSKLFSIFPEMVNRIQKDAKQKAKGQIALFGGVTGAGDDEPTYSGDLAWSKKEILAFERESVGFYVTGHPLEDYKDRMSLFCNATTEDVGILRPGASIRLAAVVFEILEKTTKKGDVMGIATVEDLDGTARVVIFPEAYKKSRTALSSGDPVLIIGRIEADQKQPGKDSGADGESETSNQIIAEDIFILDEAGEQIAESVLINIRVDNGIESQYKTVVASIKNTLMQYPGNRGVSIHVHSSGKISEVVLPKDFAVTPTPALVREIRRILGTDDAVALSIRKLTRVSRNLSQAIRGQGTEGEAGDRSLGVWAK